MPFPPLCYVAKCVHRVSKPITICWECTFKYHCNEHKQYTRDCDDCWDALKPHVAPGVTKTSTW